MFGSKHLTYQETKPSLQTAVMAANRLKQEAIVYQLLSGRCQCIPRLVLHGDLISGQGGL